MAILLISPEPWDGHAVSKHHYARTLASQGHRVLFLDPPDPQFEGVALEPVADQPGLVRVRAPRVSPGLQHMPGALRRWLERRWLSRLERLAGCSIEVIWLFENSRFFDLRFAGSRLKIYHQVDLNQAFHPALAAKTANICFCSSQQILSNLRLSNSCSYFIQHGFQDLGKSNLLDSCENHLRPRFLNVAYLGNLDMPYIDWDTMFLVVDSNPGVHFHFIGEYSKLCKAYLRLGDLTHVSWWGKIPSSSIVSSLERMDALILCYSQSYKNQVSNPHKIMEYLASGRAVIATFTEEYVLHRDLFSMSDPGCNSSYPRLFESVIANLNYWNSSDRMERRRDFAADHTYTRQLLRIQDHLTKNGLALPIT
jgi:hypothetical protein